MEKYKYIRLLAVVMVVFGLALSSCGLFDKDDDDPVTPVLTPSEVTISEFEETAVAISAGEAPFQLSGGNALVAAVTVNDNAIDIKALKAGTSFVIVKGIDGGAAELVITVTKGPSTAPELTASTVEVREGEIATVEVTNGILPFRLSGGDATIASVAINNATITVKGLREGTSTVTVAGRNGASATLNIRVTPALVDEDGFTKPITDMIPQEIFDKLDDLGMPIHPGGNPPNMVGSYLISPNKLMNSSIPGDNVGSIYDDATLILTEQNNSELTIMVDYEQGGSTGEALGGWVIGEGDRFSIFVELLQTSTDGTKTRMARIFSGKITDDGISEEYHSLVMLDDFGDPLDKYIEIGEARLFSDSDGLAERISSVKSHPVRASVTNLSSDIAKNR